MRIALVTAFRSEAAPLLAMLSGAKHKKVDGVRVWRGGLGDHEVCLAVCGLGPEKARESLARVESELYGCGLAVNFGVCGALDRTAEVYQVVPMSTVCAVSHFQRRPLVLEMLPMPGLEPGALVTHSMPVFDSRVAKRLAERFNAGYVDMEAWEVASYFKKREVPTAVVKAVSDHADQKSATGYALLARKAAKTCALAVHRVLLEL